MLHAPHVIFTITLSLTFTLAAPIPISSVSSGLTGDAGLEQTVPSNPAYVAGSSQYLQRRSPPRSPSPVIGYPSSPQDQWLWSESHYGDSDMSFDSLTSTSIPPWEPEERSTKTPGSPTHLPVLSDYVLDAPIHTPDRSHPPGLSSSPHSIGSRPTQPSSRCQSPTQAYVSGRPVSPITYPTSGCRIATLGLDASELEGAGSPPATSSPSSLSSPSNHKRSHTNPRKEKTKPLANRFRNSQVPRLARPIKRQKTKKLDEIFAESDRLQKGSGNMSS